MTTVGYQHPGDSLLAKLVGQEVTAVSFVASYLEIQFDRFKLSFYSWPKLRLGNSLVAEVDMSKYYEHELRKLLGKTVTAVDATDGITIQVDDQTSIELPASAAPIGSEELLQYHLDPDGEWMVWSERDPPFCMPPDPGTA